jgi:hypothetical protein
MNEFQFYDASAAIFNTADFGTVSRPPTALRGNADLILFLILTVINWVEGFLNFTYVESIWECVENKR